MVTSITTPCPEPGGGLPSEGILEGKLLIEDYEGKSALEYLLPKAPFEASWWAVEPGCTSFPDQHTVQEIWLIAQGSGRMTLDGQDFDVTEGQVVFIPSQQPHQVTATGERALVAYSVWW
ncbi:cupin domain-containing protein [Streptomyces sp. W16]|uniref:cupin domain-containing protein n=1 Tax=Streptomyces sp. W16 TaxID=3076631 RepID=UPI00295A5B3D|nr:cupin domain-containing protein [Streptomyces sp. W16]MDV9176785.1 cupin domain-containing protein [Streptomyces sp. W16]